MAWRLDLWDRFRMGSFWWMHAMVSLWLLFAILLSLSSPSSCTAISGSGDGAAGGRLRLAASGALGAAGAEHGDDPGRGRGEPGMVDLLRCGATVDPPDQAV